MCKGREEVTTVCNGKKVEMGWKEGRGLLMLVGFATLERKDSGDIYESTL